MWILYAFYMTIQGHEILIPVYVQGRPRFQIKVCSLNRSRLVFYPNAMVIDHDLPLISVNAYDMHELGLRVGQVGTS